mmetsp:Transcript_91127/g.262819  ORF Transcript_91127/g.262819 Transcript_91127/m.262819 type:complete len:204 (-) Transcript_91127:169-780(-)
MPSKTMLKVRVVQLPQSGVSKHFVGLGDILEALCCQRLVLLVRLVWMPTLGLAKVRLAELRGRGARVSSEKVVKGHQLPVCSRQQLSRLVIGWVQLYDPGEIITSGSEATPTLGLSNATSVKSLDIAGIDSDHFVRMVYCAGPVAYPEASLRAVQVQSHRDEVHAPLKFLAEAYIVANIATQTDKLQTVPIMSESLCCVARPQ